MCRIANRRTESIHARIASPVSGAATNAAVSAVKIEFAKLRISVSLSGAHVDGLILFFQSSINFICSLDLVFYPCDCQSSVVNV